MICRARPKYLIKSDFQKSGSTLNETGEEESMHYFNSGRASLVFLLDCLKEYWQRDELIVGLTSFNCSSSMDAILRSKCKALLLDIKLSDFSLSFQPLKNLKNKPDVLILVHYQGIPNEEYFEIAEHCSKNDIFLVDDLSHVHGSMINNVALGSLSSASLFSYAFDKPFTSFVGGALKLSAKTENELLREIIDKRIRSLSFESADQCVSDLKKLELLFQVTQENYYSPGIDKANQLRFLDRFGISVSLIARAFKGSAIFRLFFRILGIVFKLTTSKEIKVERLRPEKISLIRKQQSRYKYSKLKVAEFEEIFNQIDLKLYSNSKAQIHWNRLSILDPVREFLNYAKSNNIEASNYNWSETLADLYSKHKDVIIESDLSNSQYASANVLNIPIWQE